MKKLLYLIPVALVAFAMSSCKLDYFPSDELNADSFLNSEEGVQSIIDGCYSMFKDQTDYLKYESGNSYVRHYFQTAEFPSDNVCNSNRTSDPLYQANTLTMYAELNTVGVMWWIAYKVSFSCNNVIEKCKEGTNNQLLGEAYFLRAMTHFHMVTLFAKPYVMGRDNLGIVLRNSTNTTETKRATVGECYDQIVADLIKASELMTSRAGANKGYASKETALGLLSRVYLYMGEYDKVIDVVKNQMGISSAAAATAKLDPDLANYFANAKTSQETLFCVAHTDLETRGQSSIGSMLLTDGIGWGEIYPSDPLMNLWNRYGGDVRYSAFVKPQVYDATKTNIYFPGIVDPNNPSRFSPGAAKATKKSETEYTMEYEGQSYAVKQRDINGGEYKQWYVENFNGENLDCRVMPQMMMAPNGGVVPMYYYTKFSYQDGDPMLSSPVFLRWGEVILNLAEAYAQKGQDAEALELVNVIRTRAGIPAEGLFSTSNKHGYDPVDAKQFADGTISSNPVLNIVLDERRMELAFEGHRMFDQVRNKLNVDRRYAGVQYWEIVKWDETRIQNPIPFDEISTSGIQQNPGY